MSRDSLLIQATQTAVDLRRTELKTRKLELIKFQGNMAKGLTNDEVWKSYSQLCPHEVIELAAIENELQIIDRLMIKTQQEFQKLGGVVEIEIRRSDVPTAYYKSLKKVEQ